MVWIPGGTFRMGSDKHYPEERPQHRVTVDGFWMDRYPVSNARFTRFVDATGHQTYAEIPPRLEDYPDAIPDMLYAGSLVFQQPPGPVNTKDFHNWWTYMRGADWRHPYGPADTIAGLEQHPVVHVTFGDAETFAHWEGKEIPDGSGMGICRARRPRRRGVSRGATNSCRAKSPHGEYLAGGVSLAAQLPRRVRAHVADRRFPRPTATGWHDVIGKHLGVDLSDGTSRSTPTKP